MGLSEVFCSAPHRHRKKPLSPPYLPRREFHRSKTDSKTKGCDAYKTKDRAETGFESEPNRISQSRNRKETELFGFKTGKFGFFNPSPTPPVRSRGEIRFDSFWTHSDTFGHTKIVGGRVQAKPSLSPRPSVRSPVRCLCTNLCNNLRNPKHPLIPNPLPNTEA